MTRSHFPKRHPVHQPNSAGRCTLPTCFYAANYWVHQPPSAAYIVEMNRLAHRADDLVEHLATLELNSGESVDHLYAPMKEAARRFRDLAKTAKKERKNW